jgi:hypothetical protein
MRLPTADDDESRNAVRRAAPRRLRAMPDDPRRLDRPMRLVAESASNGPEGAVARTSRRTVPSAFFGRARATVLQHDGSVPEHEVTARREH